MSSAQTETFSDLRDKLHIPFFMEVIILAAWSIWIIRNNKIFNNENPTIGRWKAIFKQELRWVQYRLKAKHLGLVWYPGIHFISYLNSFHLK
jgi:hypothetical protein